MQNILNQLFLFCVKNKSKIVTLFKFFYVLLVLFLLFGSWAIYFETNWFVFFYSKAVLFGQIGLLLYILTAIPGITRRFGIRNSLIQIIMLLRRYIGISVFLFVLIHYWFQRGIVLLQKGFFLPETLFEYAGFFAFSLLFLMFITSNDISVKKLGSWWGKIHGVTYVVVWLIFMHTFLQRISIWSIMIGATALLQVCSHVYKYIHTPPPVPPPVTSSY